MPSDTACMSCGSTLVAGVGSTIKACPHCDLNECKGVACKFCSKGRSFEGTGPGSGKRE